MKIKPVSEANIFTQMDYAILRAAIKQLPGLLSIIVAMRFWERHTLDEISVELGVSLKVVEASLAKASALLRETCLRHPAFSRSKFSLLENFKSKAVA